jgi:hypothetical protein
MAIISWRTWNYYARGRLLRRGTEFMLLRCLPAVMICLLVSIPASLDAASVPFAPAKDNLLIQQANAASQLSNGLGDLFAGRTNQDGQGPAVLSIRRGLVEFDLTAASSINGGSVPVGATVTSVTLTLRQTAGPTTAPTVALHRVTQEWDEGTSFMNGAAGVPATEGDATWLYTSFNATTPGASNPWITSGGDYVGAATATIVTTQTSGAAQLLTWSSVDNPQMITDVQSWLDAPAVNHGWIVTGDEAAGQTVRRFNGGESTTAPNQPPVLTVTFVIPEPACMGLLAMAVPVLRRRQR